MDDLVQELDEDVEGMQSTIFFLQQQLREKISSNTANSSSSQNISEHLVVTVNTTELCAQCRAAQEKKQMIKHANCSDTNLIKMEVDNSIDEENSRTQDSSNSSDVERTLQNGEYSPSRGEPMENKFADKRTTRANRHSHFSKQSVNLSAESTSAENKNRNSRVVEPTSQCNNAFDASNNSNSNNKAKSHALLADAGENRASEEEDALESTDADLVKPPAAKRTKICSGSNHSSVDAVGQLPLVVEEPRTVVGQLVSTSRGRNGAVEHS